MGLFDLFKSKETYRKPTEQETYNFIAERAEKNGDWKHAFYYKNKAIIDLYDQQIGDCRRRSYEAEDTAHALQPLYEAKSTFESFRSWCLSQPDGERYFDAWDHVGPDQISKYQRYLDDIAQLEYKLHIVIPSIIEQASAPDGVLQSELVKSFDLDPNDVRNEIRKLEEQGKIYKEKSGRSYVIRANL